MASKLALYTTGYEDERFEHNVSQTFHCIICTNVIKDAVTCSQNDHLFCRCCITQHLMNSQTCPSCMEPLTVDTLSQAPRSVKSLLSELKIRCEFYDRGCGKFVELGDLERHVKECGFAPAVCSNEDCKLEVNRRDLLHHETAECEQRRVKCHNCENMRQEMDAVKLNLAAMNEKLDQNEKSLDRIEANIAELVQEQLTNQEESIDRLEAGNLEMKESLIQIRKLLEKITQPPPHQTSHEVEGIADERKSAYAEEIITDSTVAKECSVKCDSDLNEDVVQENVKSSTHNFSMEEKHVQTSAVDRQAYNIEYEKTEPENSCYENTSRSYVSQSRETSYAGWPTRLYVNTSPLASGSTQEVRTSGKKNKKKSKKIAG